MIERNRFVPLGENEAFLETLIQQSLDGIMVIDARGVVRFANPAAKTFFKGAVDDLEGYHFGTPAIKENVEIVLPIDGWQRIIELRATDIIWQGETAQLAMLRDITDRVKMEGELRERERLLLATNRMARVGGWEINQAEGTVWWSEITRQIHEVPPDFVPSFEEALSFFPEEARGNLQTEIESLMRASGTYDIELPFVTAKGNHLWVRAIGKSEFNEGKLARLWGTFQDITERKEAELALRKSEHQYRELFENDVHGFALNEVVVDEAGEPKEFIFIEVNRAFENFLGLDRQDVIGQSALDVMPELRGSRALQIFGEVFKTGESQRFEYYSESYDSHFMISAYQSLPGQVATIFNEITERKKAEEELLQSEKKFRTMFIEMVQGVVYQNAEGVITSANPAAERILGLSHDQLLGKTSIDQEWQSIRQNGDPLSGERHPAMVALRTGERVENFVFGINSPNRKETVWIDVSAVPQFREGEDKPYQVFTTFLDITDRIRIQRTLEERVKELRCISNISRAMQQDPTISKICQITVAELILAMQYPELAKAKVELAGERYQQSSEMDCEGTRLEVPIRLHGEQIGRVCVSYGGERDFILPDERSLLETVSERLASYYDRMQTQQALAQSEERFHRSIIAAPYPLAIYTEDGEILTINKAWTTFSGYEPEEIPRVSDWLKKAYGVKSEKVNERVKNLFELQAPVNEGEQRIRVKDGSEHIWYFRSAPLGRLQDGRKAVVSMATDITERVKAQKELADSEERFRRAFFNAPYPIMIHAEDGKILTVNDAWTDGCGYRAEELQTLDDWIEKAFRDRGDEEMAVIRNKYLVDLHMDETETAILTAGGEQRIWQFTMAPLGSTFDGSKTAITIARDITKRQQYYDRLHALQEIDQVISATLDLEEVLDRITEEIHNVVDYDSLSVMLLEEGQLEIIAAQGFDNKDEIIGWTFPNTPDYPNFEVITEAHPVTSTRISEDFPEFTQPNQEELSAKISAWLGVPLVNHERVIGMFAIDRFEANAFTDEDIIITQQFANRAAIAIDNARLYERTRRQLEQLSILRKIDGVITSSLNLDRSLAVILRQVQKGLGVDAVEILLYDNATQELVLENTIGMKSTLHEEITIPIGYGYSGQVAKTRKSLLIPSVDHENGDTDFPVNLIKEKIVSYYGFPLETKGELIGVINLLARRKLEPDDHWIGFAETLCSQVAIAVDNITLFNNLQVANQELRKAYDKTIEGWAKALELRDQETQGHSERVVGLSIAVAKRFGFKEEDLPHLRRGIFLHDIGKMGIPDRILNKPGPLSDEEWVIMRQHPEFAHNMLKDIDFLKPALNIPRYHHERWDGSGYPEGLVGKNIPLAARIFMVVDIWDALTSNRPYRGAWSEEKTIAYLKEQAGKMLDPEVVAVFLEIIQGDPKRGM